MTGKSFKSIGVIAPLAFLGVAILAFGIVYGLLRLQGQGYRGRYGTKTSKASQATSFTTNCPATACIKLLGKTADPDTITVTTGSYVQFNSADGGKHNMALEHSSIQHDDSSEYESGDFKKDEAWKVQIKQDGAYTFRDKYNPGLKISIVAYTKGKDYKIQ